MNTMSLYYDPEVLYKNNLIFHFMNLNENLRNLRDRKNKINEYMSKPTKGLVSWQSKVIWC